jgi:hypothetical protein
MQSSLADALASPKHGSGQPTVGLAPATRLMLREKSDCST